MLQRVCVRARKRLRLVALARALCVRVRVVCVLAHCLVAPGTAPVRQKSRLNQPKILEN